MNTHLGIAIGVSVAIAFVLLTGAPPSLAAAPQYWVVTEDDRRLWVIDTNTDAVLTPPIVLGGAGEPKPWGVASSTLAGSAGEFAFVTQGPFLRVVDVDARVVVPGRSLDVRTLVGNRPVTLRGCEAARTRRFLDASDAVVLRNHLFVAGDVQTASGIEPRYFVFDQQELLTGVPVDALVATGTLTPDGASAPGLEALDVDVHETPRGGEHFQVAWFTVRRTIGTPTLYAVQLAGTLNQDAATPWQVVRRESIDAPAGSTVPSSANVSALHSRHYGVVGLGYGSDDAAVGELTSDGCCGLPQLGDILRLDASGIGSGGFHTLGLGATEGPLDAVDYVFFDQDPKTCEASTTAVGTEPVDLDVTVPSSPSTWGKAYVANAGSNSVTVISDGDGTTTTIAVGQRPRSGTMRRFDETACGITPHFIELIDDDGDGRRNDLRITWDPLDCPAGTRFEVYCRCRGESLEGCPEACLPPPTPGVDFDPDKPVDPDPVTGSTSSWAELGEDDDGEYVAKDVADSNQSVETKVESDSKDEGGGGGGEE